MKLAGVLAIVLTIVTPAAAQTDPIRCWWRTSHAAVTLGEEFAATLTCAAREQVTTRTVADQSRLDAAVVQLAPFEVLAGTHPADQRSRTHRFFQYHYTLRVIDVDVIGRDAKFPDVHIPYRVQTLTNGEWMAGRERTYTLPGRSMRVLSLVPLDATDIRDSAANGFEQLEALEFRARSLEIAAYTLAALGGLVGIPALIGIARSRRAGTAQKGPVVSRGDIRRAVQIQLAAIARDSAGGWTPELVSRALAALRVAAADVLGEPVSARPVTSEPVAVQHVLTSRGFLKKDHVALSSPITASDLRRAIANLPSATPIHQRAALEDLEAALRLLTGALYRPDFSVDGVDDAFARARAALRQR
jgi:hypothetical protein